MALNLDDGNTSTPVGLASIEGCESMYNTSHSDSTHEEALLDKERRSTLFSRRRATAANALPMTLPRDYGLSKTSYSDAVALLKSHLFLEMGMREATYLRLFGKTERF